MAANLTVLCAVHGPAETDVVLALGTPGSGVTVTRRCGDVAELLAAAGAGAGTVAVASADLPGLDREVVGRLHGAGVRVVALGDGQAPVERLRALGVDVVVEGATDAAVLAGVRDAAAVTVGPAAGVGTGPVEGPAPAHLLLDHPGDGEADDEAARSLEAPGIDPGRRGSVVAVWGPVGAPGRTTVAVELAAEFAGLGEHPGGRGWWGRRRADRPAAEAQTTLLVDADTYGSCVASRLGMLDDAPGLAATARMAGQGTLDVPALARHSPVVAERLRVLTGITRAARWPELPASALEVVFERARDLAQWTVIDCGPVLESDELLMYDTHAPQRNAATHAALQAADVVVAVGAADPIGVQRLVRGLEELADAPVPVAAPRIVVANRVRASAVGPRPDEAVREALARYAGLDDVQVVPDDAAALDAALLAGRSLAEHAPASPAREAFAALADRVRAVVVPASGGTHAATGEVPAAPVGA
jgi:MinD-like ATPase involved in chromosome partitioning or flagellar assembly